MAIQTNLNHFGITIDDCYYVVDMVNYERGLYNPAIGNDPDKTNANIRILVYGSKEARDNNEEPLTTKSYTFILKTNTSAKNSVVQAYEYLKTLDEFKESEDA